MQNPSSTILRYASLASAVSLAAAFTSEYGFGLKPCELCILQRVPYGIVILLWLAGRFCTRRGQHYMVYMVIACFMAGGLTALYHSGVEKHWIKGPDACTGTVAAQPLSLEELMKKIQNAPVVACDQPQWEYHGITMAMLNAAWSFMLVFAVFRMRGKHHHA